MLKRNPFHQTFKSHLPDKAYACRKALQHVFALALGVFSIGIFVPALMSISAPVRANIFTKVLKEAGEAGSKAARHGLDIPGGVGRFIAKLPQKPGHLALAAHATPEGHWKFVNGKGEVFTAASPEEMSRVLKMLSPDGAAPDAKLSLYLSEETLFENARYLDKLPKGSVHHIVVGEQSFLLDVVSKGGGISRFARVRPNVLVPLSSR